MSSLLMAPLRLQPIWLIGLSLLILQAPNINSAAAQEPVATIDDPVHPVLIRNEHSPLVRACIEVDDSHEARLASIAFSLRGTSDLGDLVSLSLFAAGEDGEFRADNRIGEPAGPSAEVVFRGDLPLKKGKNFLWLACSLSPSADLSHVVSAQCTEIHTSRGKLNAKQPKKPSAHRIGVALRKHNDDHVDTYRIPALTTTPQGTLLAVYDMRRRMSRDLQEDIDIGLSRSTDGGQTWEDVRVIMDMGEYGGLPQAENGCSDPGIIVDQQTGEIFCFAVWMNGKAGKHQWRDDGSEPGFEIGKSAQMLMVRSSDDGITWSGPENLTRTLKDPSWWLFAPAPQSGFTLPDGTLVMPVQGREGREDLATFATIMTSKDHGKTWSVAAPAYRGGNECQAAVLSDQSIMLNIRNDHERFRGVTITRDQGQTWQEHPTHRNTLIEPNCNGSLLAIDVEREGKIKHLLLFANPQSQRARTHHTLQVSEDDGRTWPESRRLLLDAGLGRGYPSLTRIDREHVGIVYEGSQADLVFERFTIDELLGR